MNKKLRVIVGTLIALLFAGGFSASAQQVQPQTEGNMVRKVSVTGVGEIQVQPDTAVVQIGVQTQAETAEDALSENNQKTQALLDTLENAGVAQDALRTQTLQLNPVYDYSNSDNGRTLTGYQASNIVEVRTDDLSGLGELLDAAVGSGANTIQGIRFEVSDNAEALAQAREAAVLQALDKATQLAELTGATLGPVLTINESGGQPVPVSPQIELAASDASVPIRPGNSNLQVTVNITWELSTASLTDSP